MNFCISYSEEYQLIFPVHPNTRNKLKEFSIETGSIELIPAVSYLEMQGLLNNAELVLTDSGGLQKEAYFHKCKCITLRHETEWTETIDAGWNRLWRNLEPITECKEIDEYGSGEVSEGILNAIRG